MIGCYSRHLFSHIAHATPRFDPRHVGLQSLPYCVPRACSLFARNRLPFALSRKTEIGLENISKNERSANLQVKIHCFVDSYKDFIEMVVALAFKRNHLRSIILLKLGITQRNYKTHKPSQYH
jgi:hypothetical protein